MSEGEGAKSGGWVDGGMEGRGKELEVSSATRIFGMNPIRCTSASVGAQGFPSLIETFSRNRKSVDNFGSEAVVLYRYGKKGM